ncbi:phosphoserine transaminase [Tessaracoccus palaemonis]|uniref:Phosphohydroxythreonine aminotransferase n=1 Tax=Tessaracoccus palaemonis TaxID=2829499 RepID=A0ABX8SJ59_9ACTN|nr:phosphoserine transaminase [Tessaracoccus palaemonis]QXT63386.1 phosphoserine transaminase [Tessaracoccus palaemonis]
MRAEGGPKLTIVQIQIPAELLPVDGRFGSGPAKVRAEALEYLSMRGDIMGTSHRQAPVRSLVAAVQEELADLYDIPDGYEVVLGNGGSTLFWDMAVSSLVENRSAHGVFGEFSRKFASASAAAPHLADPAVFEAEPGSVALPEPGDADVFAWAQNETSTGAAAPVRRIGDGLVVIDATSAAGGMEADISETDVYYFAPQKNFSSDGGLWLAFASPAAIERAERIKSSGRWIPQSLDFTLAVANSRQHQTLNTPALATLLLLEDQLGWMLELGGIEAVAARCAESSGVLYEWAEKRAFASPFVPHPGFRSPVVATIDLVDGVDSKALIAALRSNGIVDIDPYRALKRNQLRIGCYASVDPEDVEALTACIDYVVDRL